MGYRLSPLIASKIQRGLSAGRVQSSALKIVVDREKEILDFKPITYYSVDIAFKEQLAHLYQEDIIDTNAEMKVFDSMIKSEGFGGNEFKK